MIFFSLKTIFPKGVQLSSCKIVISKIRQGWKPSSLPRLHLVLKLKHTYAHHVKEHRAEKTNTVEPMARPPH